MSTSCYDSSADFGQRFRATHYATEADTEGKPVDEDGKPLDEDGNRLDEDGNRVDRDGKRIGEDGKRIYNINEDDPDKTRSRIMAWGGKMPIKTVLEAEIRRRHPGSRTLVLSKRISSPFEAMLTDPTAALGPRYENELNTIVNGRLSDRLHVLDSFR